MSGGAYIKYGVSMFGRVYSVAFQPQAGNGVVWGNEQKGQSPLRVAFEIERKSVGGNAAKIQLFNLSRESRFAISQGSAFTIRAGYIGQVDTLFVGIAHKIATAREGQDIHTEIELRDGEPFVAQSILHKPYGPGVHVYQILQDCADAMKVPLNKLPISVNNGIICGLPDYQFTNGFTADGAVSRTLEAICKRFALTWSMQCGKLTIIPKNHYNCREVVLLSQTSGLINTPGRGANAFTMSSLLNGKLVPNQLVLLDSTDTQLSKTYKIINSKFTGDTHGPPWQVDLEANLYTGNLQPLPVAKANNFAAGVVRK